MQNRPFGFIELNIRWLYLFLLEFNPADSSQNVGISGVNYIKFMK